MASPNSYRDPFWTDLAASTEQKLGLPDGLLVSVLTKGERSNASQVSEAGARTPFQIIPATRKAAVDKYGIDPYLSAQNAAEVAGRLLQDSLKRNGDDPALAVAEYHGGTDRSNWGPRTKAYVARVLDGTQSFGVPDPAPVAAVPLQPDVSQPMPAGQSTFDRLMAKMGKPEESQIANVYKAYQGGQMTPTDSAQFEADVKAGRLMLPRGASLKTAQQATGPMTLPPGVVDAYNQGKMSQPERTQLDADLRAGLVQFPQTAAIPGAEGEPLRQAKAAAVPGPTLTDRAIGAGEAALTGVTGAVGGTFGMVDGTVRGLATAVLNGTFGTQDAANMVEQAASQGAQALTYAPRTQSGQDQTAAVGQVLQQMLPAVPLTGEVGALARGMEVARKSSAPMIGSAVSRVLGRAETGMPQTEAGAIAQGEAAQAAAAPAGAPAAPVASPVAPVAPAAPVAPVAAAAPMASAVPLEQLAGVAKKAAGGSEAAAADLASAAAPNAATVAAAKRLGILDYLQPDHVTTSQTYRELAQAVKSIPGSETRAAELQGLERVGARAAKIIDDLGGSDVSAVSENVQQAQLGRISDLSKMERRLYDQVRDKLPARTPAPADGALGFLRQRAEELGGAQNLSPMEKTIATRLTPGEGGIQPTYTLLDDVRRDVGAVTARGGPFADADVGLAKKYYGLLAKDQLRAADAAGQKWPYLAAQYATKLRKGVEDDMTALFGRELDKSIATPVASAVTAAAKGDAAKLAKVLQAVPEDMRRDVVAAGLQAAFRTQGTPGPISFSHYAKWYGGLLSNKQAYATVMTNLEPAARKQLSDLYRVSRGIAEASRERITTGRIQAATELFRAPDSLAGRLYDAAHRGAVGAAVGTTVGYLAGPGIGGAIASALTKGPKPAAIRAVDALIASPEFDRLARAANPAQQQSAVKKVAASANFARFMRQIGAATSSVFDREAWIYDAMTPVSQGAAEEASRQESRRTTH